MDTNEGIWKIMAYRDSNIVGDKDKRLNVIKTHLVACLVSWKLLGKKMVALSLT